MIMKTIVAFFLLLLVSCKDNKKQPNMKVEETFSWGATVTNPHGYPVEIESGYIADNKKPIASFMNLGSIDQSWDYEGDGVSGGEGIPTNFSLTWLSFADKKFWKAQGQLPAHKILALFKEGYRHTDMKDVRSKITYKRLVFGLAPGGHVVVWLGGLDQRVELASFQAKEDKEVDISGFWRNPDYLSPEKQYDLFYSYLKPETQDYIKKHGLPIGKWETYRKRYNYRFVSKHYKPSVKEEFYRRLKYYNGEEEILQEGELDQHRLKAIPYSVKFYYKDNGMNGGLITFNDQEMMEVFETVSKKHPNEPIDINVKVGFEYKDLTFTVVCGATSLPLKKVVIERMFKGIID
jgi:hypothetical protein